MGGSWGPKFDVNKHLHFNEIKDTGKTKVWEIQNSHQGCLIGIIKWNGGWRKYCFYPYDETVYDSRCLDRIVEFMNEQMEARRLKKMDEKPKKSKQIVTGDRMQSASKVTKDSKDKIVND